MPVRIAVRPFRLGLSALVLGVGLPPLPPALAQSVTLPPVQVTGEKRDQDLFDTPTSTAIVTGARIEDTAPAADVYDTFRFIGNVLPPTGGNLGITIRGVDADGAAVGAMQTVTGATPRATVFVDGVPQSFNSAFRGGIPAFGLERVEVLRGPQSTVQGANSIAGAVVVRTADPSFTWEGKAEARYGRFDDRSGAATLAGPVSPELAFRVTAEGYRRDNWITYTNPAVGAADPNPEDEYRRALSAKVLFAPDAVPDLNVLVGYRNAEERRSHWDAVDLNASGRTYSGTSFAGVFTVNPQSLFSTIDYRLTDGLTLRSVNSYSWIGESLRERAGNSADYTYDIGQLSTEQRLAFGSPGSAVNGLVAFYYFRRHAEEEVRRPLRLDIDDRIETLALFGETTVRVAGPLEVLAGGRVERQRQTREGVRNIGFGPTTLDTTVAATVFLPKVGVRYRVDEDLSFGATVRKGYQPGGAGNTLLTGTAFEFTKEEVWTYELDARARLLDDRVLVAANLFRSDYTDQQVNNGAGFESRIVNVPSSRSYGAEIEAQARITPELQLFGSLGLLDTRFASFRIGTADLGGNDFARAPEITASLGAAYRASSGLFASADAQYVSGYHSDIQNLEANDVDARVLVNAQVGYEMMGVSLFGFARNLLDSDAETYVWTAERVKSLVPPRVVGVGLRASF